MIMRAESGRREQDALPHNTRVRTTVEGTKSIFYHPQRWNRQQTPGQGQMSETDDVQTNGNVLDDSLRQ